MRNDVTERGWLATIVVIAGILILAAGGGMPLQTADDQTIGGRLASLVTCVLPDTAARPPVAAVSAPETSDTTTKDCGEPPPYGLSKFWITC